MTMLSAMTATEKRVITFRFANDVPVGVTINTPVITKSTIIGNDTAGAAGLTMGAAQVVGTDVLSLATPTIDGVTYQLKCEVQASDGEVYDRIALLPIRANAAA